MITTALQITEMLNLSSVIDVFVVLQFNNAYEKRRLSVAVVADIPGMPYCIATDRCLE